MWDLELNVYLLLDVEHTMAKWAHHEVTIVEVQEQLCEEMECQLAEPYPWPQEQHLSNDNNLPKTTIVCAFPVGVCAIRCAHGLFYVGAF